MFEGLFQPMHLLVILGIAVLVFGPKKIPELGKGLGEGIRSFRSRCSPRRKPRITPRNESRKTFIPFLCPKPRCASNKLLRHLTSLTASLSCYSQSNQ